MLPKHAFSTDKLFVAWARSVNQEEFYLAVWKNEDSWRAASQGQNRVEEDWESDPERNKFVTQAMGAIVAGAARAAELQRENE